MPDAAAVTTAATISKVRSACWRRRGRPENGTIIRTPWCEASSANRSGVPRSTSRSPSLSFTCDRRSRIQACRRHMPTTTTSKGLVEIDGGDGLADERRMRRDDDLHELGRVVELALARLTVLLDRVQGEARLALDRDDFVRRRAHEQHVALGEHRATVLVVLRDAVSQPFDDLEPAVVVLVEIRHRLADPARLRLDDELRVVTVEAQVVGFVRPRLALRQEPAAERHVDDGEGDEGHADRRDAEDAERLLARRSAAGGSSAGRPAR